ncbi:MAG: helix-turn-helix transcriptional regulator [Methanotrichaceae archaeon]|jgi:transcriptional regulator with XRE-family HTH domain
MTKPAETKERFIELRASGMTLSKAAMELDVSYNTVVNWERDLKEEISVGKAFKLEELLEKYRMTKERRIELFGERLLAILEELAKRDLSDVPTPKLFEMMIRCSKALEAETDIPEVMTEVEIDSIKRDKSILGDRATIEREKEEKKVELEIERFEMSEALIESGVQG